MNTKRHRKHQQQQRDAMLFLLGFIFCLIFLKHHLCHFNDHTVTGCRNDVPTKARVSTSFSFFLSFFLLRKSAHACLCVALSTVYTLNAFFAYFQFAFVILARCLQGNRDFQTHKSVSCVIEV